MNMIKGNMKYILIGGVLLLFIGIIFLIIYCNSKTPSSNNNNNDKPNTCNDDSDCPQPPSTLEYNRSLAPPKRNNNIVNACAAGISEKRYDKVNGFYFTIPGDSTL